MATSFRFVLVALSLGVAFVGAAGCSSADADAADSGSSADQLRIAATPACAAAGGECRSNPNDPMFPANCMDDFGRSEVHGTCSLTQTCCAKPSTPDPVPACAAAGGECLGSPSDPTAPASCLEEYGLPELRGACGSAATRCCQLPRPEPVTCQALGGTCKSSPNDPSFAANCEDDFGGHTLSAACASDNQTCCALPPAPAPPAGAACMAAGGECTSSPVDPRFPASCEDDFGRPTLSARCGANQTCCGH